MYIDEAMFRDVYHRLIYIDCEEALEGLADTLEIIPGATGVLAYCFAEDRLGTSFLLLASAKKTQDGLEVGPRTEEKYARVRFRDVRDYEYELASEYGIDFTGYEDVPELMSVHFESGDKKMRMLRELEMLDSARNLEFPDFVSVKALKEGFLPEVVWVRVTNFDKDTFYGTLLDPPKQGFGYQADQEVYFRGYNVNDEVVFILGASEEGKE